MKDDVTLLSAYLDQELDADERALVEQRLSAEPELAEQLRILQRNDAALRQVFDSINNTSIPDALQRLLDNENTKTHIYVVPKKPWRALLGAAACLTLALTFALGYRHLAVDSKDRALQYALSNFASGEGNDSIRAEFTFITRDNTLCRQYLLSSSLENMRAISCFDADKWQRVASIEVEPEAQDDLYAPAGKSNTVLDQYITSRIQGTPLTRAEEQIYLERIQ